MYKKRNEPLVSTYTEDGSFIIIRGTYLHTDGNWYRSMMSFDGHTGFFGSKEMAQEALDKYSNKMIKKQGKKT